MTYHPHAVNHLSIVTWASGTATSICSPVAGWVASWFTSNPALIAQTTATASQGGVAIGIIGLVGLALNRVFDDRKGQREERQREREERDRIREHDDKIRALEAKLEKSVGDLATSRENRHREAKDWNNRLLDLQARLADANHLASQAAQGVNANSSTLRRLADDSGFRGAPTAAPIHLPAETDPEHGPIPLDPAG